MKASLRHFVRLALPLFALAACGPRTADIAMHEGIEAHRADEDARAEARYRKALALDPGAPGAWNNLALLALEDGELTPAIRLLEEELDRHPRHDAARLNRALVLLRLGRSEDAAEALEPMAGLGGGVPAKREDVVLAEDRARVLLSLSRWQAGAPADEVADPARRVLERRVSSAVSAEERDPVVALARRVVAWQAAREERWDAVVDAWPDAPPSAGPDARLLAWALWRRGAPQEALEALGEPAGEAPTRDAVLRAHLLARLERPEEARRALEVLPEEPTGAVRVAAERLLAALEARAGRWESALAHLDAALEATEAPPAELWLSRAVTLARLGRVEEARLVVAGVLRDVPDHSEARELHELLR